MDSCFRGSIATRDLTYLVNMVPFIHRANQIEVTSVESPLGPVPLYDILLSHTGLKHRFILRDVHLEPDIKQALAGTGELEIHVWALDANSQASKLLGSRPSHVVTGITSGEGLSVAVLPSVWRVSRLRGSFLAALAITAGLLLVFQGFTAPGALLWLLGGAAVSSASRIPSAALVGHEAPKASNLSV